MKHHCQRRDFRGRRVMAKSITYVGLDVHKDTIAVALAEAGLRGEVRQHGKILNTSAALKALTVKLVVVSMNIGPLVLTNFGPPSGVLRNRAAVPVHRVGVAYACPPVLPPLRWAAVRRNR